MSPNDMKKVHFSGQWTNDSQSSRNYSTSNTTCLTVILSQSNCFNIKEFVWNCWNVEQSRIVTEKLLIPGAVRIMFLSGYSGHTVTLVLHMSGRQRLYNLLQLNIPAFTSCLQSVNNNYWWLTILLIKRQKDCSLECRCLQSIFELNMFHELSCLALCLQMQE